MKRPIQAREVHGTEAPSGGAEAASRDARIADLIDACLAGGDEGGAESVIAQHPEFADELRAALAGFDFVERAAGALSSPSAPAVDTPLSGTLGDFRLVREVGRGGMGVVYEAEQISLGRKVALKVLPFAAVLDDRQLQRFRHEAQAAALLHHTNIVPVYSVGTERGVHYYAMQFIDGRTLAEVIGELRAARPAPKTSAERARGRRPSPRAAAADPAAPPSSAEAQALTPDRTTQTPSYCRAVAQLGAQAADALDHAHENGVIHRDVKPANLMVDARGHLWITDFGLARSRGNASMTMTGTLIGTLRYMSPEQALAKRVPLDHRTDVYSLGVSLYEALALEPAFPGDDPHRVLQDIAVREPPRLHGLNPAVGPALETILMKAVAKDPDLRYRTAREMADDLRRYLDDKPVLARRPPIVDRVAMWARRHRAAVVAAAAVLVVAVVALAVSAFRIAVEQRRTQEHLARAQANFALAREAVDRTLTLVGEESLAGVPGLEPVRRRLLEDAAAFYRGFLEQQVGDVSVQLETARAHERLGAVLDKLGDFAAAEASLAHARTLLLALVPADGAWAEPLDDLVHVELARARLLQGAYRPAEALGVYETAMALAELGERQVPGDPHMSACVAEVCKRMSFQLVEVGRFAKARGILEAALAREETLLRRSPGDDTLRVKVAGTWRELARLALKTWNLSQAEDAARRGLAQCESAATAASDSDAFDVRAALFTKLGEALLPLGRFEEAEAALRTAALARERQTTEFPHFPLFALAAAESAGALAAALERAGKVDEAPRALADALDRHRRFSDRYGEVPGLRRESVVVQLLFGRLFRSAGKFAEAEVVCRKAVEFFRAQVASAPDLVSHKVDLAWTLGGLAEGRLTTAETVALLREQVTLADDVLAQADTCPANPLLLSSGLHNLGNALFRAGDLSGAEDALRRSVGLFRQVAEQYGEGTRCRQDLARALANWGRVLHRLRRISESERALRQALEFYDSLASSAPDYPRIADERAAALFELACLETSQGRLEQAETLHRRRLEIREGLATRFPLDPVYRVKLLGTFGDMIDVLRRLGRREDADRFCDRYVELAASVGAPGDVVDPVWRQTLQRVRGTVGAALCEGGRSADALADGRAGLDQCRAWSAKDPDAYRVALAIALTCVGNTLRRTGQGAESEALLVEAVETARSAVQADPGDQEAKATAGYSTLYLGKLLRDTGRPDEAEPYFRECVAVRTAIAAALNEPESRCELALTRSEFHAVLCTAGRYDDALRESRAWLEQCRRWSAEDAAANRKALHCATLSAGRVLHDRGRAAQHAGDLPLAEESTRAALQLIRAAVSESGADPLARQNLASALGLLAYVLSSRGATDEAVTHLTEACAIREALLADAPTEAAANELSDGVCLLARIENGRGNRTEAQARFRRCRDLDEGLVARSPTNVGYRTRLMRSCGNLGDIARGSGRAAEAEPLYRRAIELGTALEEEGKLDPRFRNLVASCCRSAGVILAAAGRPDEAEHFFRRCVRIRSALVETSPAPASRGGLADVRTQLSGVLLEMGRTEDAEREARAALDAFRELAAEDARAYRSSTAAAAVALAQALRRSARLKEAEPLYAEAIAVSRELIEENANDLAAREELGYGMVFLSKLLRAADRPAEAEPVLRGCLAVRDELAARAPEPRFRIELMRTHNELGGLLRTLGRADESVREVRTAVDLCSAWAAADPVTYHEALRDALGGLVSTLRTLGRHRDTVEACERLIAHAPDHLPGHVDLVRALADGSDPSLRDTARAIEAARVATERVADPDSFALLGTALACDGRWKDARAAYEKAHETGATGCLHDWIYEALARAHLGEIEPARALHDRATAWIEANPETAAGYESVARRRGELAAILGSH